MQVEVTEQDGYEKGDQEKRTTSSRRSGKTKKTLRTDQGPPEIEIPRDPEDTFEPEIIPEHQCEFKEIR